MSTSTNTSTSGCLTGAVAGFSRFFLLFAWIGRPLAFNAAFGGWIMPCLGFLFLPFTTLMWLILVQGVGRVSGLDYLWLGLAVVLDLASVGAAGASNRHRIPAGVPGSTAPPAAPPPAAKP
ncbi:MAG: hypothetical protein MUO23_08670 [Anaerolineales bacterium]|nr:hypothetical protein [Anaerolineales bacterium]